LVSHSANEQALRIRLLLARGLNEDAASQLNTVISSVSREALEDRRWVLHALVTQLLEHAASSMCSPDSWKVISNAAAALDSLRRAIESEAGLGVVPPTSLLTIDVLSRRSVDRPACVAAIRERPEHQLRDELDLRRLERRAARLKTRMP